MREIKFRVYDKKYKKMYYGGDIKTALSFPQDDCEIMQFTGLRDKKGKEIFEGDIVKHEYYYKPEMSFTYCEKETEIIEIKIPEFFEKIGELKESEPPEEAGKDKGQYFEIIGNVFENPELLTG